MSATHSIAGDVVNGSTVIAAFTFYVGPVGVCERDGYREVAFFAPAIAAELPSEGILGGEKVTVIDIRIRDRNPHEPARGRDRGLRAIIATVIPSSAT